MEISLKKSNFINANKRSKQIAETKVPSEKKAPAEKLSEIFNSMEKEYNPVESNPDSLNTDPSVLKKRKSLYECTKNLEDMEMEDLNPKDPESLSRGFQPFGRA